jgi:predicted membrane protein
MGEMITKPDANPILLAVLNGFIFGIPIGYFMIGQTKKGIAFLILNYLLSCTGIGTFLCILLAAYDIYLLGQKLAAGESIGQNENGVSFLDNIFKD